MSKSDEVIPRSWLIRQVSVEKAESNNTCDGVAFGCSSSEWAKLKTKLIPGDEVWEFSSPVESWRNLAGRAGIAIVRDQKVVDCLVTMLN